MNPGQNNPEPLETGATDLAPMGGGVEKSVTTKEQRVSKLNGLWTPVLGIAASTAAVFAWRAGTKGDDAQFFSELAEVKHLISSRYVDVVDEQKLKEGAIRGMVEALNDPYTEYVPASEQGEFNKGLTGEYVGIGATVNVSTGWLTIVSPLEDSPAFRAGLMPEDKVLEVDGVSTQGVAVDECVGKLMGKAGTPVVLHIDRKGQVLDVTIVREKIKTRSVKGVHRDAKDPEQWDYMIDHGAKIAYVRVTQFTPKLSAEVDRALRGVHAADGGVAGLILDLRSNPGGLLREAEEIADLFLKDGTIVSTRGRAHEEEVTAAQEPGTLPDFPIVVMLNGESASASEVLAGALADNNRAIILGTRSYGKGSVQSLLTLSEGGGSELKMTEQGYYLPSGRSISRKDTSATWGVDPTPGFYVPMTPKETAEVMLARRQIELLLASGGGAADAQWDDVSWTLTQLKDKQLSAAVRAVQDRLATGAWKTQSDVEPQFEKIAADELQRTRLYRERLVRELLKVEDRVDALTAAAKDAGKDNPRDFWADETDLAGGTLEVKDKDGHVVSTLSITGNNLERWLLDADVEKPAGTSAGTPAGANAGEPK